MLIKKIQNFVHLNELWQPKAKIVVAVSGGADSSFLLHILAKLAPKYAFKLHLAHVNYGLRGKESDNDEAFVRKLARKYQLPLTVFSFKKAPNKTYAEEELRNTRYAFFETLRQQLHFDLIALAHNQDDQAETVLMRILRGTGLAGLAAMKAKNGSLIRPLLTVSRQEIENYLQKHKLPFCTDHTNTKPIFTRNKIRLELLPYLEKHFNPKIKENLSTLSLLAGEDYAELEKLTQAKLTFAPEKQGLSFEIAWFLNLSPSLQKNCLRLLLAKLVPNLKGIENAHLEEILKLAKSTKGKLGKTSFQGLSITKKGAKVYMILQSKKK